ncbi:MAG: PAS domain S-box protein [Bdellovibrionales bacterium]|nr:PAS domain S-box protein [Bdellovibrionales bacterium]
MSRRSYFSDGEEKKKRRKEWLTVIGLGLLFLFLTWTEFQLFEKSRTLPLIHSIFFFGLVNFNIILFLLLIFLIFRNIVKNLSEREGGLIGSTLKSRLIAAFVGFSFIPTALMFLVSVFYINNSFDKWFSEKTAAVLKSSLEVTNAYYVQAKRKNYHFAHKIAVDIRNVKNRAKLRPVLKKLQREYSLDAVEFYPSLIEPPIVVLAKDQHIPELPEVTMELKAKGITKKLDDSTIHHFGSGNLVRVIVPAQHAQRQGAIVVSSFVPLSLIGKMDDIAAAYEDFSGHSIWSYPLKSIYLIILVLMTLVILLGATWAGFYIAKQLSIPLVRLSWATQRVAQGDYHKVELESGSPEINELIGSFNHMIRELERTEGDLSLANQELRSTLSRLDAHTRYIEIVLSDISTGVISVDKKGHITMVNRYAEKLLQINGMEFIGRNAKEVMNHNHFMQFFDMLKALRTYRGSSIQKNIEMEVGGRILPLQASLSLLFDDKGEEIGKVIVFDDLTAIRNTQRSHAWKEVARRIAHEIKNPLTPISLSAQRLQKKFGQEIEDPAFADCTSMIIDQVNGLKTLVNEFGQFARMPNSKPVRANLNRCISEVLPLFAQAHKNIEFLNHFDENIPDFLFDPDEIKRAVTNLVKNAVASLKDQLDGRIELSTDFDNILRIVRIVVSDNGPGIPTSIRDRVFEPYVTTKSQGTGLGLAIVKRTVEDHDGFIRAEQNGDQGTKIVIELPVILNVIGYESHEERVTETRIDS